MKEFEIELENGMVLRVCNNDDEVVVTWDNGSINLLNMHTTYKARRAEGGEMVLDTLPNAEWVEHERRAAVDAGTKIDGLVSAKDYMTDVLGRQPFGVQEK
jgi:hypothetical protein